MMLWTRKGSLFCSFWQHIDYNGNDTEKIRMASALAFYDYESTHQERCVLILTVHALSNREAKTNRT